MSIKFNCKELADDILVKCAKKAKRFERRPVLAVIQVGEDPASDVYVRNKIRAGETANIEVRHITFSGVVSEEQLIKEIDILSDNDDISGIIVQQPLPAHLDAEKIVSTIPIHKDADGFHSNNLGDVVKNIPSTQPCTPKAIVRILQSMTVDVEGINVVVVGRSNIVGKPIANILINMGATVTVCHSKTTNLKQHTTNADVVILAVGRAEMFDHSYFKKDAIVVDVGINRRPTDGKLCGDLLVNDSTEKKLAVYTPVPGGVGPMTVAMLMENTIDLGGRHVV